MVVVSPGWRGCVPHPQVRPGTPGILLVDCTGSLSQNSAVDFETTDPELSYRTGWKTGRLSRKPRRLTYAYLTAQQSYA